MWGLVVAQNGKWPWDLPGIYVTFAPNLEPVSNRGGKRPVGSRTHKHKHNNANAISRCTSSAIGLGMRITLEDYRSPIQHSHLAYGEAKMKNEDPRNHDIVVQLIHVGP